MDGGGGDLGIRVKITPVIDQAQLKGEGKKVEKLLGSSKLGVKATSGIQGGGGISGKSAAIAGAVGGLVASAVQGLMGIVKKIFGTLVESSGALKGVMKMLNMGFMQILRPIGDVLAMLLRPVAMFFRTIGREVMKRFRDRRKELLASGMSKQEAGVQLMGEMPGIYFEVIGEQLAKLDWSKILGMIGKLLLDGFLNFNPIGMMLKFLMDHGGEILASIAGFGLWLWDAITGGIGDIATTIGKFGEWLYNTICTGIGDIGKAIGDFGNWLWTEITTAIGDMWSILSGLGQWIWDEATGQHAGGGVSDTISAIQNTSAYQNLDPVSRGAIDIGGGAWNAIKSFIPFASALGLASGGITNGPMSAIIGDNPGGREVVSPLSDLVNIVEGAVVKAGGGGNVTVVIPGGAIADAIDRRVDHYYRTKVANRR